MTTYNGPEKQRRYVAGILQRDPDGYRAKRNKITNAWRQRNLDKHAAHNKVYRAIKSGKLIRPDTCERCNVACKPEASHDDYTLPFMVEWLCRACHAAKDRH